MEQLKKCPVCQSEKIEKDFTTQDYMLTGETFSIFLCKHCELKFTNPRPNKSSIGKYYKSEEYISHTDKSVNPVQLVYKIARNYTVNRKEKLCSKLSRGNSILDYGCGTGDFLKYMNKKKWDSAGIEPDDQARQIAKEKGLETYSSLDELQEQKYDIITLWHVLEHIHDLHQTFELLKSRLKSDGTMIIAVPNWKSFDAEIYGKYWAAWDVPRHLYHFSRESINELVKEKGMSISNELPMRLDSYYVSLLSNQYKYGTKNVIEAIKNGRRSNKRATINNNFSSITYIINN